VDGWMVLVLDVTWRPPPGELLVPFELAPFQAVAMATMWLIKTYAHR
jgi:hypothetical protein